ncbi:hypothetical protein MMC31_007934 [Peltigera leucophlebia]|nr:hypothetical protein [Peltigera leucophlebia]
MTSEKISNIIRTIDEWIDKFKDNNAVSYIDKEMIAEFGVSLLIMGKQMEELCELHENETEDVRKAILHGKDIEYKVEEFIDGCCKESHMEGESSIEDAIGVDFVNPPPNPWFFRAFFNNMATTELIMYEIQEGNRKISQVIFDESLKPFSPEPDNLFQ